MIGESRGPCGMRTPITMEWPDVQRRIAGGEDARTEFKGRLGDLRGVGRTVCAFASGDGGLSSSAWMMAAPSLAMGRTRKRFRSGWRAFCRPVAASP